MDVQRFTERRRVDPNPRELGVNGLVAPSGRFSPQILTADRFEVQAVHARVTQGVYILAAIRWEERDLVAAHPEYAA
jgi:hypothetical protein